MEEKMYGELIKVDQRTAEYYQMIFAPYQAHELVTLDKLLSSLVEEEYCIAKQLLAIKIGGILDITDLKNSYDLSAEKLQEIRNLAEQYEPKKNGNTIGICQ